MNRAQSIALVTGANRGLGKETASQLASLGYKVVVAARSKESAEKTVLELGDENLFPAELDVTSETSIQALAKQIDTEFGRLDVLVNNAAIHYDTWQSAISADLDIVREAMETNVYGAWHMVQAFLPLLRNSDNGRIVNVSSGAGALGAMSGNTPAYSLSKVSLNALTLMLSSQLKGVNILVNSVCPGWVATDMAGRVVGQLKRVQKASFGRRSCQKMGQQVAFSGW
ncbi:probable short chain oxidoreductase [Vibrio ishigakensis]|uniref:Probable short chain oxidoreductase n=1 Tax=Vibrio ishigakensis TaxID=1481914 RepID=A0A0B8Q858_9VIBR|nr:probable short chain oxidoreductase [Vibrio ishigakensis]